jgi:hypothetical protein
MDFIVLKVYIPAIIVERKPAEIARYKDSLIHF